MEKILKLYTYIDGVNDSKFPNDENQIEIYDFTYDVKRMGGAPTISATVMYPTCLDDVWVDQVYAEFNGEKYFLKQTPTSSFSNKDVRYKHEVDLVSERIILDNVYFYDVVSDDFDDYKPVTNSSKVTFYGDIHEFANRLKYSLEKSGVGYDVVVDEGITSEEKLMSFEKQFFSNVLQEVYNTYELPYYFVGKTIHIGYTDNTITEVFKYGVENSLLSITKTNSNNKIVNRITGVGSSENIPYYYPNDTEKGGITAIASNSNQTLKTSDIKVVNPVLFGQKIDLTIDENNILPSSLLVYQYSQGKINRTDVSTDYNGYWVPDGFEFPVTHVDYKPIYVYVKVEFEVESSGIFNIQPRLYVDGKLYDVNKEVSGLYYNATTGDTYNIFVIDNYFRINNIVAGKYVAIFTYSLYQNSDKDKVKNIWVNNAIGANLQSWNCNGKTYSLSEIGISIADNVEISVGDSFYQYRTDEYVQSQSTLMPSIYRETNGNERFYNALNETYMDDNGEYYVFDNPYIDGKPKEHIENFEDIKPTIKEAIVGGYRIDMFSEFAYDTNDNDETEEDDNGNLVYKHPYFFGKLRKLDFNLFDHAIESGGMTISMTSGNCGACNFVIGVDSENQKNKVQVDENGNLLRDDFGDVRCEREGKQSETAQDEQNDTINNEVWIALKKDIDTFGTIMPNNVSKPTTGDTFVILNILLPKSYIINAEKKLDNALIKYMSQNNNEIFNYSINFSRIYFAENPEILDSLNENSRISVQYNNLVNTHYVSSYSYKMSANSPLPEIKVELTEELNIAQNAIQNAISGVKGEVLNSMASMDWLKFGLPYFVRKDIDDYINGVLRYKKGLEVGKYTSGILGTGGSFKVDEKGNSHLEADYLTIRKKATFTEITTQELKHIGGQLILSPAAMMCSKVEEKEDGYYCYFENVDSDGREIFNEFIVGDQARCQTFNIAGGSRYYWRLVTAVGRNYIVLSKKDCDEGSDIPVAGDNIVQLGNRTITERKNAQILSSYGEGSPYFTQYVGINDFSLEGKEQTRISPNGNLFTGQVKIQPNSKGIGNFTDLPEEVNKAVNVGGDNILRNSSFAGNYESIEMGNLSVASESMLYSPNIEFWDGEDIVVIEEPLSKSGYAVNFSILKQKVTLIEGDNYVATFCAKADSDITVECGIIKNLVPATNDYEKKTVNFIADGKNAFFVVSGVNCTIYDIKLERGTIATDWNPSILDNDKIADEFKHLQYISQAMKDGNTDIIGGLILSSLLQVGKYKDNVLESVTAGVNGGWYDDNSVAFWAGGTLEQAITTVSKFISGETPTEEDWVTMAKFVATHGGDIFMRGYVNALGVLLRGKLETKVNGKRLVIDPISEAIQGFSGDNREVLRIDWESDSDTDSLSRVAISPKFVSISDTNSDDTVVSGSLTPTSVRVNGGSGALEMNAGDSHNSIITEGLKLVIKRNNGIVELDVRENGVYVNSSNGYVKISTDETSSISISLFDNYDTLKSTFDVENGVSFYSNGLKTCTANVNGVSLYKEDDESKLLSISRGKTTPKGDEIAMIRAYMQDIDNNVFPVLLYREVGGDSGLVRWQKLNSIE